MRALPAATACALVLVLESGTAFAQSTSDAIYACVGTSGTLRIVASATECRKNENLLNWNAGGPIGPRGPSNAFVADNSSIGNAFISTDLSSPTTIAALQLSPGNYVLNGVVGLYANIPAGTLVPFVNVACRFADGAGTIGAEFRALVGGKSTSFASIPLTAAITLSASDTVAVTCVAEATSIQVSTQPSVVTAIQVESLSGP